MKVAIGCLIGLVFIVSVSAESLLEGRVRLESGEPVADAQVRIFDMTDLRQGAIARALTDGTGYFALPLAALTGQALPARFALGPNYPNPFNPSTIIPYQLAASSAVRLEVFNLLGQRITTLVDGERPAGFHTATWHATDVAGRAVGAGVYIYRMTVGVESQTGRMVLLDGQAGVSAAGAASVMPGASGIGRSDGADAQVYGLIVSGSGLVPYVDSSFRVESGMAPVELVVSSGQHSAGKVTDDDCAFCDLFGTFNDQQEEEEDETPEEEAETDSTSSEGGPDLIVQAPSVSVVMLTPGQEFTLNATVHNQGDEQAAATMLHYYRSNNATITSSDTEVGTDEIGTLDASATSAASIALTAPTSVSAEVGIYYGACVASVRGESNTDNNCSSAVRITVSGQVATEEEATEEEATEEEATEEEATEEEEEPDTTPVTIPDANLRAAIAAALDKASGAPITVAEMKTLTSLEAIEKGIRNLRGLETATNLTRLVIWGNHITDISPISELTNLTLLWLDYNNIPDISLLSGLTNLTNLSLNDTNIPDLSVLSDLPNLTHLRLIATNTSDVSPLSGLTNLTSLVLSHNKIADISPLSGLTKLTELNFWENQIEDISALSGLTNLTVLGLGLNNVEDISALSGLTNLTELFLNDNNITYVSSLSGLTNLTWLSLAFNNVEDISALSGLTNLMALNLAGNSITDISPLAGLTNLGDLDLRGNPYETLPKGDFDIELVLLDDFTESQKQVLQYVARRWMAVITEDLPDYEFAEGWSGTCGGQSFEISSGERIDDLRIYVATFKGRGGVLGGAGLHVLREETHLPVFGCMTFDLSHANLLITGLHEIGHVLGFASEVWSEFGFYQNPPNGDAHFNGPLAIAAFDDTGGRDYKSAKVPLQTSESHWRVPVLEGELMAPYGGGTLSAITVQSLADLGYGVDVTQADPYTLPGVAGKASAKIAASMPSIPGYDIDHTQANAYTLPGVDPYWQGSIAGGLPSIFGDDHLIRRLAPHPHTEPQPLCSLVGEREPIYVVDQQGRIIRTIGD